MQRLLILIVALSLVIGTQSVCPIYKGKKCGGTQSHILRGKTFDAKHGECVQNGDKEECECEHFTAGRNCERCQDMYNDLPWTMATTDQPFQCKSNTLVQCSLSSIS